MKIKSSLIIGLERLLSPLGIRVVSIAKNRVRGIDLLLDIDCLLNHKSSPVIFDVGANNGDVAQEFLEAFPSARLVAFEPFTGCYESLKTLFANQTNIRVENIALGEVPSTGKINLYSGNNMNSLLEMESSPVEAFKGTFTKLGAQVGTAPVKIETIDNFCRQNGFEHVDLLKIDTQGFDLNVLKGASLTLKNHSITVILIEINFIPMYKGQASFLEIHAYLDSFGYRLVGLYNHSRHDGYTAWCDACYVAESGVKIDSLKRD